MEVLQILTVALLLLQVLGAALRCCLLLIELAEKAKHRP
jgi:hypothetical protein